jgi:hypothetical protein
LLDAGAAEADPAGAADDVFSGVLAGALLPPPHAMRAPAAVATISASPMIAFFFMSFLLLGGRASNAKRRSYARASRAASIPDHRAERAVQ